MIPEGNYALEIDVFLGDYGPPEVIVVIDVVMDLLDVAGAVLERVVRVESVGRSDHVGLAVDLGDDVREAEPGSALDPDTHGLDDLVDADPLDVVPLLPEVPVVATALDVQLLLNAEEPPVVVHALDEDGGRVERIADEVVEPELELLHV